MLNKLTQLKAASPFVLDHITHIAVMPRRERAKNAVERQCLMRLRMAVMISVFKRDGDHPLDDVRVNERLNQLLDAVRGTTPSLSFYRKCVLQPFEITPGYFLKTNHACTEAVLYRSNGDNVVYLRA